MALPATRSHRSSTEPSFLRRAFLAPAAIFPLWHLAAPAGAWDPWWLWWATGSSFFVAGALSLVFPAVERRLLGCFHVCSSLITAQFFVLSASNDMAPFYVVAWAMSVLAAVLFIRTVPNLARYAAFLVITAAALWAIDPDEHKLAYWGGLIAIVPAWALRLRRQETSARRARQHKEELERRVRERTGELADANAQLRREMEERARLQERLRLSQTMEAVGRLAGGVAHEFNNLLTTIRLYGELALDRTAEGAVRDDLARIQKAAQEAAAVTEQLLDFSRGADAEHEAVDLGELVEDALPMLEPLLGDRIRIVTRLEAGPLPIWAAPGPLERILLNLALNARDAMPDGGELAIETERLRPDDARLHDLPSPVPARAWARMAVCDDGIGMDAATRARVFDPFFSRRPVGRGAGLGLSIVYGIVRQTDGHVSVESEPGKGTRFEIVWPCTERARREPPRVREGAPRERGSERILLVEDEAQLRSAMARVLGQAGYDVAEAGSADEALRRLAGNGSDVDLVVSDVVMPGTSGIELAERLRTAQTDARVLLISGHAAHRSLRDEAPAREVALLRKPFPADVLRAKVREVLDDGRD